MSAWIRREEPEGPESTGLLLSSRRLADPPASPTACLPSPGNGGGPGGTDEGPPVGAVVPSGGTLLLG